jgi:hypothetical protein
LVADQSVERTAAGWLAEAERTYSRKQYKAASVAVQIALARLEIEDAAPATVPRQMPGTKPWRDGKKAPDKKAPLPERAAAAMALHGPLTRAELAHAGVKCEIDEWCDLAACGWFEKLAGGSLGLTAEGQHAVRGQAPGDREEVV